MRRVAILFVALVGCQPRPTQPIPEPQPLVAVAPTPIAPEPHAITTSIDFANWPTATRFSIRVAPEVSRACSFGLATPEMIWFRSGDEKRHGPHFSSHIVVRINPEAEHDFKGLAAPLPVGTVVVKEKHKIQITLMDLPGPLKDVPVVSTRPVRGPLDADPTAATEEPLPQEYGAMIKREEGYDPEHGDWEYLYVVRGPEEKVTRGKLANCIDCHSHAKHRDYVFRTYLKADGVKEW